MVIVGVACELGFVLRDHWENMQEWRQSLTRAMTPLASRPSRLKLIFELLSVALVVVGIVGELRIDAMLGDLDTRIQDVNNQRLALVQQEAGDAAKSAKAARDALGEVELKSKDIIQRLDTASSKMGLIEDAIVQREPRANRLDPKDKKNWDKFLATLSPFKTQQFAVQLCTGEDNEMLGFFAALETALRQPEDDWTPAPLLPPGDESRVIPMCQPGVHLMIDMHSSAQSQRAVVALHNAIKDARIEISDGAWQTDWNRQRYVGPFKPDVILIQIGAHP